QIRLVPLDPRERLRQARPAGTSAFYLGSGEVDPRLIGVDDVVLVEGFPVARHRLLRHAGKLTAGPAPREAARTAAAAAPPARRQPSRSFWRRRIRRSAATCPTSPPMMNASAM